MKQIDANSLKLKVQRYLMPNVDDDGTVSVENAERYFLNLIDKEEEIKMKPLIIMEIDFNLLDMTEAMNIFNQVKQVLNEDEVKLVGIPKGVRLYDANDTNAPILIYDVDKKITMKELWRQ